MASPHQKNQRKNKKHKRDKNAPYPYTRKDTDAALPTPTSPIARLLQQADFLKSAQTLAQCPPDDGVEVAFAGRSNAGKSSALNTITNQRKLARTSKTPGRTQLINFFRIDDQLRLVDLPGYGYAQVPESMKKEWQANMSDYMEQRECLAGLVLVMDIRHPLRDFDVMMLEWSVHSHMPVHILLSKADKLKKGPATSALMAVEQEVAEFGEHITVQLFSSQKKEGLTEVQSVIEHWLQAPSTQPFEE